MKRLLIAAALLVLTLLLCIGPNYLLEHSTTRLLHSLDLADRAVEQNDLPAATAAVTAFCRDFEQDNRRLPLFFPHEKLDAIEESTALLSLLVQQDTAHLAEELSRCRWRVEHLRQSERLTLTNIF